MNILLKDLSDLNVVAQMFLNEMSDRKVFAFYGEMGVGKTTFIKAICEALGVKETITSPTFAIVNEYKNEDGKPIFHFDFYRIKNLDEVYDFGYEDYFYSGNLCFIEWPELVETLLPDDVVKVQITVGDNEERLISIK
ncbi:MAG: tRNA (adenosine(37)-N6)-threonylcarbamoyltransferase complex ATPase subunit type 1 TsaE [Dysgonamonadaceae bacterium]|jgi:tRNA threonylcarbamoyladenosine biosynthesis protein TsaE|nr:tRNA (adenosine(37)-N6)-threonylcarbamoyltransferase complex ATPase subunit type 1 TsaE [Dysgonamonadaceae bacterium]